MLPSISQPLAKSIMKAPFDISSLEFASIFYVVSAEQLYYFYQLLSQFLLVPFERIMLDHPPYCITE
jgi:hypothetical protein